MPNRLLLPLFFATLLVACSNPTGQTVELPNPGAPAAIAVPDAFGARVAEDILTEGGNAVDAAVGAAFALAVTYPEAGNIGGGGFMLLYMDGAPAFLDYRETAPAMATRDMYLDEDGDVIQDLSLVGQKAAAVPGTVAGLWAAHQRHGTLPWSEVVAPAVRLADEGFPVPAQLPERIRKKKRRPSLAVPTSRSTSAAPGPGSCSVSPSWQPRCHGSRSTGPPASTTEKQRI